MKVQYSNNAISTVASNIEVGHTVLIVASASTFPILSGSDWMYVTVEEEVVKVTNTSGNVFTCEAFSQPHGVGASVQGRITTRVMERSTDADVFRAAGDKPSAGTMREGELFANPTDVQIGVGDASGNPIEMVAVRFHSSAAAYVVGDLAAHGGGIWKASLTHVGAWDENNWEPISGSGGGLAWELSPSGTVTAETGKGYLVTTSSAARQVDLPVGVGGETVGFCDLSGSCNVNAITVISNGSEKIMGLVENFVLDINDASVHLIYSDATVGWKIVGGTW